MLVSDVSHKEPERFLEPRAALALGLRVASTNRKSDSSRCSNHAAGASDVEQTGRGEAWSHDCSFVATQIAVGVGEAATISPAAVHEAVPSEHSARWAWDHRRLLEGDLDVNRVGWRHR